MLIYELKVKSYGTFLFSHSLYIFIIPILSYLLFKDFIAMENTDSNWIDISHNNISTAIK